MAALASIVDTKALLETVIASFAAGVGVTVVFSLCIVGVAQLTEARRDGRQGAAIAAGALAMLAFLASLAAVAVGIVVMTSK
jgi:cytochrome c biogenesis protein CcdA